MFSSILPQSPSLRITISNNIVFLHPSTSPDQPTNDPILNGRLHLSVPKRRQIRGFTVTIICRYDAYRSSTGWESGILQTKDLGIQCDPNQIFEKGDHVFEFSIVIPSWFPTYERSPWGRIYHKVVAKAHGAGHLGTDVVVERPIHFIANPAAEGETLGLHASIEGFVEEVGPYSLTLSSAHLTIASLLHTSITFASPPHLTNIVSITGYVIQTLQLNSVKFPNTDPESHVRKKKIFQLNADSSPVELERAGLAPFCSNASDSELSKQSSAASTKSKSSSSSKLERCLTSVLPLEGFSMAYLARLPDDDTIRPTTQPGTASPLRFSHEILITVHYQRADDEPGPIRELSARRPIVVSSCCCTLEVMTLPSYTPEDPDKHIEVSSTGFTFPGDDKTDFFKACICGTTYEQLVDTSDSAQDYSFMQGILTAEAENRAIREALENAKATPPPPTTPSRPSTPI